MIWFVIPCSGPKLDRPAPARELYTGTTFTHVLRTVLTEADATEAAGLGPTRVLILSAAHGLLELDDVIAPYDVRMGDTASITPDALGRQAADLGIDWRDEVYAFLPAAYLAVLDAALRADDIAVQDVFEAAPGIGYQRGVCSAMARL